QRGGAAAAAGGACYSLRPWQTLYFLPEPHGHSALRAVPGNVWPSLWAAAACGALLLAGAGVPSSMLGASPSTLGAEYCRGTWRCGPSRPLATSRPPLAATPSAEPAPEVAATSGALRLPFLRWLGGVIGTSTSSENSSSSPRSIST